MVSPHPDNKLPPFHGPRHDGHAVRIREELRVWLSEVDDGEVTEALRNRAGVVVHIKPAMPEHTEVIRLALEQDPIRLRLGIYGGDIYQQGNEIFVTVPWPPPPCGLNL